MSSCNALLSVLYGSGHSSGGVANAIECDDDY